MQIYHDDMETVGTMVQSIVSYFQIQSLESRAVFPAEFKEAEDIIAEVILKKIIFEEKRLSDGINVRREGQTDSRTDWEAITSQRDDRQGWRRYPHWSNVAFRSKLKISKIMIFQGVRQEVLRQIEADG